MVPKGRRDRIQGERDTGTQLSSLTYLIYLNVTTTQLDTYEILVGNKDKVKWVPTRGSLKIASLDATPVAGGKENDGTPLYIAQAPYGNNVPIDVFPGKVSEGLGGECKHVE